MSDPIDLADDLWTLAHIAKWLHMNAKAVQQRVVCRPGFPKGFRPTGSVRGERRWHADEVREWAKEAA